MTATDEKPTQIGFRFHLMSLFAWTAICATWIYFGLLFSRLGDPVWGLTGFGFLSSFGVGIVGRFAYLHGMPWRFTPLVVVHAMFATLFLLPIVDAGLAWEAATWAGRTISGPIALAWRDMPAPILQYWPVYMAITVALSIWGCWLRPSFVSAQLCSTAACVWYACGFVSNVPGH